MVQGKNPQRNFKAQHDMKIKVINEFGMEREVESYEEWFERINNGTVTKDR